MDMGKNNLRVSGPDRCRQVKGKSKTWRGWNTAPRGVAESRRKGTLLMRSSQLTESQIKLEPAMRRVPNQNKQISWTKTIKANFKDIQKQKNEVKGQKNRKDKTIEVSLLRVSEMRSNNYKVLDAYQSPLLSIILKTCFDFSRNSFCMYWPCNFVDEIFILYDF